MANRVSSSSYNRNNHRQNISSSNNRSSRSTLTTHTYASTNTFNTEPTYTTTPIAGDPRTLHSYYVSSSNYRPPPTSPTNSLTRHYREYEPSYPSITRYRTPSSSSPFRKTHYLDDSDEEIINEEILEITDLNHYPTLIERWGDDAKTVVRQEGEFKFEDFVEFEEVEPTVVEEILYELVYSGDKLKTCRQIDRSRSESRNFRKIKKRRTKRKRPPIDDSSYLTSQPSSRDTSGTRSPYYHDHRYSPERSSTPTQSTTLSSSWQSTGFIPNNKPSLDISIRNSLDDGNYVNYIRVNETDPFLSHTLIQQYPQTRITSNIQYNTFPTDLIDKQNRSFYDKMHDLSSHIDRSTAHDDTLNEIGEFVPVINEERGITKIDITPASHDYVNENLLLKTRSDTNKDTYDISSSDDLLTSTRTTDNREQSRINIIDQTSVQKETDNREQDYSTDMKKQINKETTSKYDELEKDEEEQSSATEPTIRELVKHDEDIAGRDTDEDASFSESEQISSQLFTSDEQKQSSNLIKATEESHPSSLLSTNEKQDDHEIITTTAESSINKSNELESQLQTTDSVVKSLETNIDQENIKPIQTIETSSHIEHVKHQLPEDSLETTKTLLEKTDETSIPTSISEEKNISLPQDKTRSENDRELRSMLNSITAHLMPELPRFDEETEDEQSFMSETKSSEEPISQDDQSMDSIVQKSIEDAKELWVPSHDHIPSDQIESSNQTKTQIDQTTLDQHDIEQDNEEKSSLKIHEIDSAISNIPETNLDQQDLTIEQLPSSTDSLVHVVEQIITNVKKPQHEQDIFSQASSVVTDEISPTQLQSKQLFSQDTDDVTQTRLLNVNYLADIIYQIHSQPLRSSLDKQQIYTDTQQSIESTRQEDRLSSIDSIIESTPSVITSDKQQKQQQLISSMSSITSEAMEKPTSKDDQSSTEFQSRKEIGEPVSVDSLVNIVRQMHTLARILRLISADIKTETTHINKQEIAKPLADSHVEIVIPNESIPRERMTIKAEQTHDTQELIPKPSEISLVTEHKQETTSEKTIKEDEPEHLPSESLVDADWETLVAPVTSPTPSHLITTEAIVTTEKHDEKPRIDLSDRSILREHVETLQKNLHDGDSTPSTSLHLHVTETTSPKIVEDRASEDSITKSLTTTTQVTEQTASEDRELPVGDKRKTYETERHSFDALTEIARAILATPLPVHRPLAEIKTDTVKSVDYSIEPVVDIVPSTLATTLEEMTQQKAIEAEKTQDNKESTETARFTTIDKSEEQPSTENLTTIICEMSAKTSISPISDEESSESPKKQKLDVVKTKEESVQQDKIEKIEQPQTQDNIQPKAEIITTDRQQTTDDEIHIPDDLTKSIDIHQPLIDHVKQTTYFLDQKPDNQPIDSLTKDEVSPKPEIQEQVKTPKHLQYIDLHETTTSSSTTEPRDEKLAGTTVEELKPRSLSTEELTITVPQPQVTPVIDHQRTVDHIVHRITETKQIVEKPSSTPDTELTKLVGQTEPSETVTIEEEITKPVDTHQQKLQQPSVASTLITIQQESTIAPHPEPTEEKAKAREAERLSSEALAEAIREILATPVTVHLPEVDHTVEQITQTHQQVEKPLLTSVNEIIKPVKEVQPSEVITLEEETTKPVDTKQEALQQPSTTSSDIESVHETTTASHLLSSEDKVEEREAERLSTQILTEVVREILAVPLTVHLPEADHTLEQVEKPSPTSVSELIKPVKEVQPSEVITREEETTKPVETKQDESQQPSTIPYVIDTVRETTFESRPLPTEGKIEEREAERLSTQILTEVVREILATPLTVDIPEVDHTVEQVTQREQQVEQPSLASATELIKPVKEVLSSRIITGEEERTKAVDTKQEELQQPSTTSSVTDTVHETTTESHVPSTEQKEKEHAAERLSSEALTEAVREILATPVTVHLPEVDRTVEQVTKTEEQVEKPSPTSVIELIKPVKKVLPSEVITLEEETTKPVETKQEALQQPSTTSSASESADETSTASHLLSTEDKVEEHAAERLSSEALIEALREVLATPVTVHLPEVDHIVEQVIKTEEQEEKPSLTSVTELIKPVKEVLPSDVITREEETTKSVDSKQEELQQPITRSSAFETVQETTTESHIPSTEGKIEEREAERLSTQILTEVVREILATPVTVHLPTAESVSEKATATKEKEIERRFDEIVSGTSEQATPVVLPVGTVTEEKLIMSDTKPDEIQLLHKTEPVVKNMDERKAEVRTSSAEDTTSDYGVEHATSVPLNEDVPEVSDSSLSILPSPVELKPETGKSIEQPVITPETVVLEKIRTIPENVVSDKTITIIPDAGKTAVEIQHPSNGAEEKIEDETESIDSLIGSAHEILGTPFTVNLPSVGTDITRSQDDKVFQEQLDSSIATNKTEDIKKPVVGVHHPSVQEAENISLDSLMKVTREILTTSSIKDEREMTLPSEEVKQSIDSLVKIVHEFVTSPKRSTTDIDTDKKEISYVQPQLNESDKGVSLISKLSLSDNDQVPLQSTVSDIIEPSSNDSSFQDIISSESELSLHPTIIAESTSTSEDKLIPYDENQFISSSLYTTINTIVNDAISNACNIIEQSIPDENDNQPFVSLSSEDEFSDKSDTDINFTNDIETKSVDEYHSISGLTNIVHSILKLPNEISLESSISHEDNKVIVSPKPDFDEHFNITELPNIVDTIPKTLNIQTMSPEQFDITNPTTSLQRASAVQPTFRIDDVDQDTSATNVPTFFVPETPNSSEVNFRELYKHRHFISDVVEESSSHFTPIDRQESVQSIPMSEEKKVISDSPLAYYELQEKRHTLMSPQESTQIEKPEQISSSLTTWTTMQPLIDYEEKEKKQDITDINLDDHAYEYARRFDLESPSIISNLPTREYRQVFGVPDDIVNTVDDMTHHIDQQLSMQLKHDEQSIVSDDVKNISLQSNEQFQADDGQFTMPFSNAPVSDNVKRIIEAIEALDSDLLEHKGDITSETSSITEPVEQLISQQHILSSNLLPTTLDNDIKETLDNQTLVFPSKDEFDDDNDLLPKKIETEVFDETIQDEIITNPELDSRYSKLFEHIDNLEKPLINLQSSSSSVIETETKTTDIREEKDDDQHLQQRYDALIDHVTTLEDATIKNLAHDTNKQVGILSTDEQVITSTDEKSTEDRINIDELAKIIEHIIATPFRTVISSNERRVREEPTSGSHLQMALEQILAQTQYPTTYVKLPPPIDTVSSTNELNDQQEKMQIPESHYKLTTSASTDQKHVSTTEETPDIDEKDQTTIFEKVTSAITDAFSIITGASHKPTTTQETITSIDSRVYDENELPSKTPTTITETNTTFKSAPTTEQVVSPLETKERIAVLTSSIENEKISKDEQRRSSPTDSLEITSILRPTTIPSTQTPITSLGEEAANTQHDYIKPISSSVAGYFSSSDVYHAYKQPVKPIIKEEPVSSGLIETATTIVTNIISDLTSAFPTTQTTEDSTFTLTSTTVRDQVSTPVVSEPEISVVKPSLDEQHIEHEQTTTTGLLDKLKTFLPSGLISPKTEHNTSEESSLAMTEDQTVAPSFLTETTETTVPAEDLSKPFEPVVQILPTEDTSRLVPGYFTSSDVYHAYKQPTGAVIEQEPDSSNVIDKATAIVSTLISSITSASPTSKSPDEQLLTSESPIIAESTSPGSVKEKEITLPRPSSDEQHVEHEQSLSTSLLEMMTNLLPSSLQSKQIQEISSETPLAPTKDEEKTVSSAVMSTPDTKPHVEMPKVQDIPSSVAGYFSSSDVYHAYKQPVEPMIEEKALESSSIVEKATSIVSDIIISLTSASPTLSSPDATTPTSESPIVDKSVSYAPVTKEEVTISKPSLVEQGIEQEQTTTSNILDKLKTVLPSSFTSTKIEHITSDESVPAMKGDQAAVPSSLKETSVTTVSKEGLTERTEPQVDIQGEKVILSPVAGYFSSSDVYHAYKQPIEPIIEHKTDSSSVIDKATTIVTDIISSLTSVLPTTETTEDSTSTIKSTIVHDQVSTPVVSELEISVVKPSLDEEHIEHEQTTATGVLDKLKTFLPSGLISPKTEHIISEKPVSDMKEHQVPITSSFTDTSVTTVSGEHLTKPTESIVETPEAVVISSPVAGYFSSSDVYHAYKQPIEPIIEHKTDSSSVIDKATTLVTNIVSSLTGTSPTLEPTEATLSSQVPIVDEKIPSASVTEKEAPILKPSSDEQHIMREQKSSTGLLEIMTSLLPSPFRSTKIQEVSSETPSKASKDKEDTVVSSMTGTAETTTAKEYLTEVAKPKVEIPKTEEIQEEKSTTGLIEIVTSVHATNILPATSTSVNIEEDIETGDDKEPMSLSISEAKTTSEISQKSVTESSLPVVEIQQQKDVSSHSLSDTTESDISPAEKPTIEQVITEKDSTSGTDEGISSITGTHSGVSYILPTSVSLINTHRQGSLSEDDQTEMSESSLQTPSTDEPKHHGVFDLIVRPAASLDETASSLLSLDEKSTTLEISFILPENSIDNQLESLNVNEAKETLIETAKEILAAPLQSAVDTYEKIISTQEQLSSPTVSPTKVVTTDYPSLAKQDTVTDSVIERLSTTDQRSIDELDKHKSIPSITEETKIQDQIEKKPSQQLQVIGDDYPWYSSHYILVDADEKMGQLYDNLSYTLKQLEQRPLPTTIEFSPEPHEKVPIPDYDRQVLDETKDTREKVHELAEISTIITTTMTASQDEQIKDENELQVVHHRKHVSPTTVHERTPSPKMVTTKAIISPDIDLVPAVLQGRPVSPISTSESVSQTTTTTASSSTSSKKKPKKQKKDRKEIVLVDASIPTISDTDKGKTDVVQSEMVSKHMETTKSELLPSITTDDSHEIDQPSKEIKHELGEPSEAIKHEIEQLIQTIDEFKQNLIDTTNEEQHGELLSTSIVSDNVEPEQIDDDNNDSTSSDASQWLSSSFTTFPEDNKLDTQPSITEHAIVTQTSTTISSADHELTKSEPLPTASPTKKKKSKQQSINQEKIQSSEIQTSQLTIEQPQVESKPTPTTTTPPPLVKTITTTITAKISSSPEEEDIDDNEGFQVVRHRKHAPSTTGQEKTLPSSTTITSKQRSSSDIDSKHANAQRRQVSSIPVATSKITTGPQTTTTKPKHRTHKKETTLFDAPASSTSTDTDAISSSSIDNSKHKQIEQQQQPIEQHKTISSSTSQSKPLSSVVLTSNISPSLPIEVESKQQPKEEEKTLQTQTPSSTISTVQETKVKLEPTKSLPTMTTLRLKPSTSPDEEEGEDDEDNEGFRVVHYRKRISSAPRLDKTLPPLPPQTHKQNLGRSFDLKPVIIHGRQGSGSRSMPRTTTGSQISSHKPQQTKSKQDRQQMPPLNIPRSPTSKETHIMSSFNIEQKPIEQVKQPVSDQVRRTSDTTTIQSTFIEQKLSKEIEQVQSTIIDEKPQLAYFEQPTIVPVVDLKPVEQNETETNLEPVHATVSPVVDQSIQQIVHEYIEPTKDEIKQIVQQQQRPSIKEQIPTAVTTTTITTIETQKSTITEDDDDDGFRVVRYRKHAQPPTIISKQHSYGSDTEKKSATILKKQISSSSSIPTTPTSTVLHTTTPKKKTPKKTKETTVKTDITSPVDILSSSTTDTDLISSSKEESAKRTTTTKHVQKVIESQITTKDVSSVHPDKEITIPTEDHKSISSVNLPETVQKTSDDTQNQIQSIESATSPSVTSADTSEELLKKPKKKHKRSKRESIGVDISTPSDEISSTIDDLSTKKLMTSSSPSQSFSLDIPLTSTPIEDKSDKVLLKEEVPSQQTVEPITPIDDEQIKTTTTKKHTKRRKKKPHTHEKQDQDEDLLNSSTTSTTDKDSSSAAGVITTPMKSTSRESSTKIRLITDDDKQESEWITPHNKKKKSKLIESTITKTESHEQKVSLSPQSTLHSTTTTTTTKILPEKVTDVQFKFKKGGELTVTSQLPLERSPTEWGTVKFISEESSNLIQQDKHDSSIEQTPLEELPIEKESKIEQTIDSTGQIDNETKDETTTKSMESSETGGEADLDAYRDQTGRLRPKKPRKPASTSSKPDDIPPTLEPQTSEEIKLDHKTISEHWAAAIESPVSNIDEEQKIQTEQIYEEQSFEDDDTSERNSKLDSFLPEYIRQTIKTKSLRSSSLNDDRSKLSSTHDTSTSITHTRSTSIVFPSSSNRSTTSTDDTSENESRKHLRESVDEEFHSTEDSSFISTTNQTEHDTMGTSSSLPPTGSTRKKKQRPKMLKKDIEAKTLLTHEFDDTPLTITEIQPSSSSSIIETTNKSDESFLSSIRHQFSSAMSTITDSFSSALSLHKSTTTDDQTIVQSDEPVPSTEEQSIIPITTSTESTIITTKKKPSTRSPRKRSKRDSGPDYEYLTSPTSDDIEQSFSGIKVVTTIPTSIDNDQTDFIKVENHKQQPKQRTLSGRHSSNTEENNEQQATLADDEEDEDFATKPVVLHGTGIDTNIQTPIESIVAEQDSSATTTTTKKRRHKQKSKTEEVEFTAQAPDELKPDKQDTVSDQQTTSMTTTTNEQLRSVQGFHSYTPNKYQYNQYEEGSTSSADQTPLSPLSPPPPQPSPPPPTTTTATTDNNDNILARGFNLWLQQSKEIESTSSSAKQDESSAIGSGLTRAMQSLIIQPVETDNDEDEEDSWNGPRAKKPTYTSGVQIEKRIHTTSGYNINHPRSITVSPWLMPQSNENSYQDDQSKYDPDDEEDSMNDVSEKQQLSHPISTQLSTKEERQKHLNNLADLTFQATLGNLSSSSSSLSSAAAAKWNETSIRSDDNSQQQASFTDDDVQRCLGEDFYRESLAAETLKAEQRTITSLDGLVLKPSLLSEETDNDDNDNDNDNDNENDDDDDDSQRNRNNNNNNNNNISHSMNFDEWAHFLEYEYDQQLFPSSGPSSSTIEQNLLASYECSYARELDDDTLISDADRLHVIDDIQHTNDNERQRYGDFTLLDDDSTILESMINCPLLSSNPNSQSSHRHKPSETFQRWRNQSNREREESNLNLSNVTILTANQNDDEIFIYHTDGGLSRRVRPTT
ncbi:unnamed protein product [Rotaria sp. Silwood1]|nr:unnamed protein product [Rotaria sp. Silwood1]